MEIRRDGCWPHSGHWANERGWVNSAFSAPIDSKMQVRRSGPSVACVAHEPNCVPHVDSVTVLTDLTVEVRKVDICIAHGVSDPDNLSTKVRDRNSIDRPR